MLSVNSNSPFAIHNYNSFVNIFSKIPDKEEVILGWRKNGGILIMGYEAFQYIVKAINAKKLNNCESVKEALITPGMY